MAGNDAWKPVGELLFTGTALVAAIVLGYLVGSTVDRRFGLEPWGLVIGVVLGSLAGFVNLWRTVKRLT